MPPPPPALPLRDENPHAGQGPVLLDIGGEVGALVVTMPATMQGVEIEIRPLSRARRRPAVLDEHDQQGGRSDSQDKSVHGPAGPDQDSGDRPLAHVAVVGRPVGAQTVHCAVFDQLVEGDYELSEKPFTSPRLSITVNGGEVTAATWPA